MGKAIEDLAHGVAGTPREAIPETCRAHATLVLLDTVGVILAGSRQPRSPARGPGPAAPSVAGELTRFVRAGALPGRRRDASAGALGSMRWNFRAERRPRAIPCCAG